MHYTHFHAFDIHTRSTVIVLRHRTLTARNVRQRRINLYSRTYNNDNDNNVNNVQNEELILSDTLTCARNVILDFL
jgi:hypothetical protein